ncbi:unnamed protein product [Owenia fusiformis]|uniref:Uncharacterized protein n=1 Tax=Owenia fusiformis TaxID=6347 RepID=A0A8J1T9G5_OWEFU|nr:unnamed protein product [Owenia fusiformis]
MEHRTARTLKRTVRWMIALGIMLMARTVAAQCPAACFCNTGSKIVYCSRKMLIAIPDGLPEDTVQLNLNDNVFAVTTLRRTNFTGLLQLEHLYLSGVGIEVIADNTFSDLTKLKWLDLSMNRIRVIEDYTFRGLNLQHLFLNGNHGLRLHANTFAGLSTSGLYLHDCKLTSIAPEVLVPLNNTLKKLWIDENRIRTFDISLLSMFNRLSHIRLGANMLHCNCRLKWLKDFYDYHSTAFEGAMPPTCHSPARLNGKYFNTISEKDFICQQPVFNNVNVAFKSNNEGALKCSARSDPAPVLYWVKPGGEKTLHYPTADHDYVNTAVLKLSTNESKKNLSGDYICIASSDGGNVSLVFNLTMPKPEIKYIPLDGSETQQHQLPDGDTTDDEDRDISPAQGADDINMKKMNDKQFTMLEMILAVIGTFLVTLILVSLVMHFCYKKYIERRCSSRKRRKTEENHYVDVSHLDDVDYVSSNGSNQGRPVRHTIVTSYPPHTLDTINHRYHEYDPSFRHEPPYRPSSIYNRSQEYGEPNGNHTMRSQGHSHHEYAPTLPLVPPPSEPPPPLPPSLPPNNPPPMSHNQQSPMSHNQQPPMIR